MLLIKVTLTCGAVVAFEDFAVAMINPENSN
jgi:hypothetical protein